MTEDFDKARWAFNELFHLVDEVATTASWDGEVYRVSPNAWDNLSDFIADFHDDNPDLWSLLDTRNREEGG